MGRYKTARALEMAVRSAAQKSSMDTSAAITGFYFHRLLVRIFYDQGSPFVLKGGHGMLARTTDARRTRDIDISTDALDIDAALEELTRLASRDMDDFITFELVAALGREAALRRLVMPVAFSLPDGWAGSYEEPYRKLFRQTALDDGYRTMAEAASLAARLLDPALDGSCAGKSWNPERLEWAEA